MMAAKRPPKAKLADYRNPPISEVVYGVRFAPLKGWLIPHVGAFWIRIREDFPGCEHAPPITDAATISVDEATGIPIPRVWLIAEGDDRLVQIQPGRFHFNWRYRKNEYPHYADLSASFFRLLGKFLEFVDEYKLGTIEVIEFDLTYINHISEQEGWRLPDLTGKVLKPLAWRDREVNYLPRPSHMGWQASFPFDHEDGRLSAKVTPAKRADGQNVVVLELVARGIPKELPLRNMTAWFDSAHEWIVRGFEDLTTAEAQTKLWNKYE